MATHPQPAPPPPLFLGVATRPLSARRDALSSQTKIGGRPTFSQEVLADDAGKAVALPILARLSTCGSCGRPMSLIAQAFAPERDGANRMVYVAGCNSDKCTRTRPGDAFAAVAIQIDKDDEDALAESGSDSGSDADAADAAAAKATPAAGDSSKSAAASGGSGALPAIGVEVEEAEEEEEEDSDTDTGDDHDDDDEDGEDNARAGDATGAARATGKRRVVTLDAAKAAAAAEAEAAVTGDAATVKLAAELRKAAEINERAARGGVALSASDLREIDRHVADRKQLATLRNGGGSGGSTADNDGENDNDGESGAKAQRTAKGNPKRDARIDAMFSRFRRCLDRCPRQVLRYQPGGKPLFQNPASVVDALRSVPPCPRCGASQHLELQVMPTAVYLLRCSEHVDRAVHGADDDGMDFGTLSVFSCSAQCGARRAGCFAVRLNVLVEPAAPMREEAPPLAASAAAGAVTATATAASSKPAAKSAARK
jgi:hypothetical protein